MSDVTEQAEELLELPPLTADGQKIFVPVGIFRALLAEVKRLEGSLEVAQNGWQKNMDAKGLTSAIHVQINILW